MHSMWFHRPIWQKAYKRTCTGLCIIGFFLMLGAAGASDLGAEPFEQVVFQALLGLALFSGTGILGGFIY